MSTFSAKGFLECQSQCADPIKGRAELTATDRGFKWEAKRFLSGQTDGSRWEDVHTFGRRGGVLNIAYLFHYEFGAKPLMAAIWFEGSAADCERIEAIAREHLPSYNWQAPYESQEHGRWDSMWARDWDQ